MAEQTESGVKIIVEVTYEWDTAEPKTKVALTVRPGTDVATLLRRLGTKIKKSGLAFVHGGVEMDGAKTFAECDIPEGASLTVRQAPAPGAKRKRMDSASPEPEDMQKTPKPSPKLQWATVKAPLPAAELEAMKC